MNAEFNEVLKQLMKRDKKALCERIIELTRICNVETDRADRNEREIAQLKKQSGCPCYETPL